MMVNTDGKFECLTCASLQARHFAPDLSLEGSKLQTVLRFGDLEPTGRSSGKWRTFSPFEVLTIATLMRFKDATDLAIVRHPLLVEYLSDQSRCGNPTIAIWADGLSPALITDFRSNHRVIAIEHSRQSLPEILGADVTTVLRLTPIVELVLRAIKVGGNGEQMRLIEKLTAERIQNLKVAAEQRRIEPAEIASPQQQGPAINVSRKPII